MEIVWWLSVKGLQAGPTAAIELSKRPQCLQALVSLDGVEWMPVRNCSLSHSQFSFWHTFACGQCHFEASLPYGACRCKACGSKAVSPRGQVSRLVHQVGVGDILFSCGVVFKTVSSCGSFLRFMRMVKITNDV